MLLNAEGLKCNYGDKVLLNNVSFTINENDKIGLIGVNGTGKSTLLGIIFGDKECEEGNITYIGNVRVSYMSQELKIDEELTILEYINKVVDKNEIALHEAKAILTKLEIFDFDKKINTLSGGNKRKLSLAAALSKPCDLLLLDEPTNHLDCEICEWLEKYLLRFNKAVLFVTHDRYFLEKVCNRIFELENGNLYEYIANYSKYLEIKSMREEFNKASFRKVNSFLRKEYEWIKRGPQARGTKDKKRIEKYEELSNIKYTEKKKLEINQAASRLGNKTIIFENVSFGYDKVLFKNVSFNLPKNARIGVVGKNGIGKSSFLDLIAGINKPTSGNIEIGQTIKVGYFHQENIILDKEIRVIDYINNIASVLQTKSGVITSTQMLENFLFEPYTFIKKLSGGEKRRLALLGILMRAPNVLLFDEPTNDLDIPTLTILENYLETFDGIVIIASHDRFLLDKSVDTIFELNDEKINMYNGNYTDNIKNFARNKNNVKTNNRNNGLEKENSCKEKKIKLTYKEEKEYSVILDEINELEIKLKDIEDLVNSNYSNYDKCREYMETKELLEKELEQKMLRWEYLTEKASD